MNKVLLVEDNVVNQKVALVLLDQLGLEADVASNGREALELVSSGSYSVILMDCHMPEMDGFEAARAIRRLEAETGHYTPIVAVTALAMSGDRERCISAGMDDYVPKPIDKEMLKVKLNHWLQPDVVYRNQKLSRLCSAPPAANLPDDGAPINLDELRDFYGAEELNDILRVFLNSTGEFMGRLSANVQERNRTSVARMAHELKASCASVGAKQMAKVALFLEQACGQEDWDEVKQMQTDLDESFAKLKAFLKDRLSV